MNKFSQTVKFLGLVMCFNNLVSFWLLCPLSQTYAVKVNYEFQPDLDISVYTTLQSRQFICTIQIN